MGTKSEPGAFDCYEKAEDDEPMFILLARDPSAPMLVRLWAQIETLHIGNPDKIAEAYNGAFAMVAWRKRDVQLNARCAHDIPVRHCTLCVKALGLES